MTEENQQGQETPAPAQETSDQDSALTTEQPDQPAPTEEQRAAAAEASGTEQAPNPTPSNRELTEQYAQERRDPAEVHAEREQAREAQRREHNERTGGGEIQEGEVQAQRDVHNERTGDPSQSQDSDSE